MTANRHSRDRHCCVGENPGVYLQISLRIKTVPETLNHFQKII